MIQLGEFLPFSLNYVNPFKKAADRALSLVDSYIKEANNIGFNNKDVFVDAELSLLGKKIKKRILSITGSGITLTYNEIKDIMKVFKSLENRAILLKGTTRKITGQEGRLLNH